MNIPLIRAWMEAGAPPIDDLAPMIGLPNLYLLRFFSGKEQPDNAIQDTLAEIFGKKTEDLFPEDEV